MKIPEHIVPADLTTFYTWMGDDGIARSKVKLGARVEIAHAKENSGVVNALPGNYFPIIVDTTDIKSITKEARQHFSLQGRESKVIAIALIIGSPLSKVVGNFFLGSSRSRVPVRLFNKESQAVLWCKKIKKDYKVTH